MFALTEFSRTTQRTVCMLLSAAIVTLGLLLAVVAADAPLHDGYSVTITQIQ